MIDMSRARASSAPDLPSSTMSNVERPDHNSSNLEGVATNVMLLLKLIQDHNEACTKDNDDRKVQRVAGMMTILDDVKTRIEKSQSICKRREAELRRCNTDLRRSNIPRDKRTNEPIMDEKEILRKELNASLAARKSLEIMCSGLGKEKEIMATELARKVHELNEMEELINDLKAQNKNLLAKVQTCASEHKDRKCGGGGGEGHGNATLQERNRVLSEQLLKSLDRYRSSKRKLKEAQQENAVIGSTMEEMGEEIAAGLGRIRSFKHRMATENEKPTVPIEEEILALEHMFECFEIKVSKHGQKKSECFKAKPDIRATEPSVLA